MIEIDDKQMQRELKQLAKKVEKIQQRMDGTKSKELLKAHKDIGKMYHQQVKRNIKNYHTDTVVRKKGKEYPIVRGQLKASMGNWKPNRKNVNIVAGPRANSPMKKKVRETANGWFAHFVEEFGTQNKGVFDRTKKQVIAQMRDKQVKLYRQTIKNAAR